MVTAFDQEERIALFLDYENLAIGARDQLGGMQFDLKPIAHAMAERGRVVVRRAYADWTAFDEDRRMLTRNHVELIEMPQRMGSVRKNAADIKMAVDAVELAFERAYVTTFVICSGDSDFTPLVHKLRELNKKVIGVGVKESTSALLPPACDEFLFYEDLEGVDVPEPTARKSPRGRTKPKRDEPTPEAAPSVSRTVDEVAVLVAQTVSGLTRSAGGEVSASGLKRALLRKDPTFNEGELGFRAFGELLRHLEERNTIELSEGPAKGDPAVSLPSDAGGEVEAFELLRDVVVSLEDKGTDPALAGLKTQMRKIRPDFSEKRLGYRGFLHFVRAAESRGLVTLTWDEETEGYILSAS